MAFWRVVGRIVRLDVDNGGAVDRIKSSDTKGCSFNRNKFDHCQPDRVGTLRSAASEHANYGDFGVALGSCSRNAIGHLAEPIDYMDVREVLQPN